VFPVLPETLIPVPAVVPAVLDVAIAPDIIPSMPSDRRREFVIVDAFPGTAIVPCTEPVAIAEDEVGVVEIDYVIGSSIGDRKAVVVKVDEIRAAFEK
jgi:hypothetical protein